jgi:hypothetical protein
MPDIRALKRKYKGEWLAIEVTQESNGEPVKGKLILHNKDRDGIWEKIELSQGKEIYVTYAGPLVEKGYAVAFCVVSGPIPDTSFIPLVKNTKGSKGKPGN